jgi:hypothetical protein
VGFREVVNFVDFGSMLILETFVNMLNFEEFCQGNNLEAFGKELIGNFSNKVFDRILELNNMQFTPE